MIWKVVKV